MVTEAHEWKVEGRFRVTGMGSVTEEREAGKGFYSKRLGRAE